MKMNLLSWKDLHMVKYIHHRVSRAINYIWKIEIVKHIHWFSVWGFVCMLNNDEAETLRILFKNKLIQWILCSLFLLFHTAIYFCFQFHCYSAALLLSPQLFIKMALLILLAGGFLCNSRGGLRTTDAI